MTTERVETVVIGGGQAGLTMSHALTQHGLDHVVLERYRIAERWRSERWESLRFQFPNWSLRLPGFPYMRDDPDVCAPRDDVVRLIEEYAACIGAPVRRRPKITASVGMVPSSPPSPGLTGGSAPAPWHDSSPGQAGG